VETDLLASGLVGQGQARSRERRLSDGVVLNLEDELDGVSRRSGDTAWSETEIAVGTTDNDLDSVSRGREGSGTWRVGVRRICCRPHVSTEGDGISHERWSRGCGDGHGSVVSGQGGRWVLGTSLELSADCKSSVLEVSEGVGGTVSTTVDGGDHASATMTVWGVGGLVTEHPDWLSIVHIYSEGRPICRSNVGADWLETRAKTTRLEGTRTGKRRLGDSVVLGVEVVNYLVTRNCSNCFWIEGEGAVVIADLDVNDRSRNGRNEGEADEWDEHGWQVRGVWGN